MKTKNLRCPRCGGKCEQASVRTLRCLGDCGGLFDQNPREGGPQYADPVRNAIAKEQAAVAEQRPRRMR